MTKERAERGMALLRILQTRLSDSEFVRVKAAVSDKGTTVAALLRTGILAYIGAPGSTPSVLERLRVLEEQVRELRSLARFDATSVR